MSGDTTVPARHGKSDEQPASAATTAVAAAAGQATSEDNQAWRGGEHSKQSQRIGDNKGHSGEDIEAGKSDEPMTVIVGQKRSRLLQKGKHVNKKRREHNPYVDDEAACNESNSDGEWNENEEEIMNAYDPTDLHEGSGDEEQPPHNMQTHRAETWRHWLTLKRSKKKLFKSVHKKDDNEGNGEHAYLALEDGGIKNMLILIHQSKDNVLEWFGKRIKICNAYLDRDVGNILAQDIIETLAEGPDPQTTGNPDAPPTIVATDSCAGEIEYDKIAGMEAIDDEMLEDIRTCEEMSRSYTEQYRRVRLTPEEQKEAKKLDRDLPLLRGLRFRYKVLE